MGPSTGDRVTEPRPLRYERKFVVDALTLPEVEALVRFHPALFSEVYPPRHVNNLYLDSPDLASYVDNLDGVRDRAKVRIRWYGDLFGLVHRPVLELKIKQGLVGRKEAHELPAFLIDREFDSDRLARILSGAGLSERLRHSVTTLDARLLNRYRRRYFLSSDGRVRLTMDSDLDFYRVGPRDHAFVARWRDRECTILELKYDVEHEERAAQVASRLPFRMTKNSKYVGGLEAVNLW